MMNKLPQVRTNEIVVQELKDELLVYNLTTHQAFTLNETSKIVYQLCDGQTSFDELKDKHQLTDEIIYLALDGLQKQNLLAGEYVSPFAGMNRRQVIRRVGLASMIALPVIASLTAPSAAAAASYQNRAINQTCTTPAKGNSTECQSGNCVYSADPGDVHFTLRCCATSSSSQIHATRGFINHLVTNQAGCMQSAASGYCCSGMANYSGGICTCT